MAEQEAEIKRVTLKERTVITIEKDVTVPSLSFNSSAVCVISDDHTFNNEDRNMCAGIACCNCVFSNKNFALFMKGATS